MGLDFLDKIREIGVVTNETILGKVNPQVKYNKATIPDTSYTSTNWLPANYTVSNDTLNISLYQDIRIANTIVHHNRTLVDTSMALLGNTGTVDKPNEGSILKIINTNTGYVETALDYMVSNTLTTSTTPVIPVTSTTLVDENDICKIVGFINNRHSEIKVWYTDLVGFENDIIKVAEDLNKRIGDDGPVSFTSALTDILGVNYEV